MYNKEMDMVYRPLRNLDNGHNYPKHKKKLKLILEKKNEEIHIIKDTETWCLNCREITDHGIRDCPKKQIMCLNCKHRGHYKCDCYIYKHSCYRCLSYGKIIAQDKCLLHKNIIVCGCIIMNEKKTKTLLVKGKLSECWGFPKGALENNESLIECARRETLEETGIDFDITNATKKEVINNINYYYTTFSSSGKLNTSSVDKNEISEIKWVRISELLKYSIPNINKSIKIFINSKY